MTMSFTFVTFELEIKDTTARSTSYSLPTPRN